MTKDELTLAKIEDKVTQSRDGWYVTATGFLDSHEQALAKRTVMHAAGVRTLICTDISRDGAMRGANIDFYRELQAEGGADIIASGGVSSMDDVRKLSELRLYGAIIGKAYYTGAIDLAAAIASSSQVVYN